jgi:ABC-type sulfate transport system permease component
MTMLILGAVAISVPGVIIGLIFMNSPFLQRKYQERRDRIWKKKRLAQENNKK